MKRSQLILERARRYLARLPVAISGSGGHDAAFRAACVLVQGFGLNEEDALPVLTEWSEACDPPWSEAELLHKLRDAAIAPHDKPHGYLLQGRHDGHVRRPAPLRTPASTQTPPPASDRKPDRNGFGPGSSEHIRELASFRYHREALEWSTARGVLVFGVWHGLQCYGVSDSSGRVLELRRVNGAPFPAFGSLGERKSHAVKGSQKSWPVGILEAKAAPAIALVEGVPDFLAAHYLEPVPKAERADRRKGAQLLA